MLSPSSSADLAFAVFDCLVDCGQHGRRKTGEQKAADDGLRRRPPLPLPALFTVTPLEGSLPDQTHLALHLGFRLCPRLLPCCNRRVCYKSAGLRFRCSRTSSVLLETRPLEELGVLVAVDHRLGCLGRETKLAPLLRGADRVERRRAVWRL